MKVLFVTWDGPQVTYLESLFLPIFARLANEGIQFQVLQFTWGDAARVALARQACERQGIGYRAVAIWRRPRAVGALLSALVGARQVVKVVRAESIDVVMPRSTLPALATLLALSTDRFRMMFDADGLPLDERVEFAGQSPGGLIHRVLRDVEAQAVRRADVVLTRSAKASGVLHARAGAGTLKDKFYVVANGRDAALFKPSEAVQAAQTRQELGLTMNSPLVVYAGSLGPQYCVEEMVKFFSMVLERRPDAHWLVMTGSPDIVQRLLERDPHIRANVTVKTVEPQEVPRFLACADLGLALRRPSFSMQGVAPIKLGEYLLCGVPVLATADIGDTDGIGSVAGRLVTGADDSELSAAADWFVGTVLADRAACRTSSRSAGLARFSLEACTKTYQDAFMALGREL